MINVGVLALQGDVQEHIDAIRQASAKTKIPISLRTVRTKKELEGIDAILIPGGESTAISLLLQKEGMLEPMKDIPCIFGTCAGLIMMAKEVEGATEQQKFLAVLDAKVSRNAYGSQVHSFYAPIECEMTGKAKIAFIRAPKIISVGNGVKIIGKLPIKAGENQEMAYEPVIVEQRQPGKFYLGATCHPELTTSKVHEYFLKEATLALNKN